MATNPAPLGTPNNPRRTSGYLPPGYKQSTKVRRLDADPRKIRAIHERDHWDGSQDARVYPKPIKKKLGQVIEAQPERVAEIKKNIAKKRRSK